MYQRSGAVLLASPLFVVWHSSALWALDSLFQVILWVPSDPIYSLFDITACLSTWAALEIQWIESSRIIFGLK